MKLRRAWMWALVVLVSLLALGCQGEDELDALEIAARSDAAMEEVNSCGFEMELDMDQEFETEEEDEFMDLGMGMSMSGAGTMTFEPQAVHLEMTSQAMGMDMDSEMYVFEDTMFFFSPDTGWMELAADSPGMDQVFHDPMEYYEYAEVLGEVEPGDIELLQEEDYYVLDYVDHSGALATLLKEEMQEEMEMEWEDMPELREEMEEIWEDLEFSDVTYRLKVNRDSFLPAEVSTDYTVSMSLFGESTIMVNSLHFAFFDYDEIGEISVPDEVREEAMPADDWY